MDRIKRCNDELKADRPTIKEVEFIPRIPISILVENVRSVHNVGSIFRSADGFGAKKIYLTGYTAYPPREDLHKTALGAEDAVPWEYYEKPLDAVRVIKKAGNSLVLIEQTITSQSIYEIDYEFPICFIVGNEVDGVSEEISELADIHAELPMLGIKQSLNVSVAVGVVGYEFSRNYRQKVKNA
jgi:tRNA G18 (ribose-2'-O)-methylase SpoU